MTSTSHPPRSSLRPRTLGILAVALASVALATGVPGDEGRASPRDLERVVGSAGVPTRVAGADRYGTAVKVARRAGGGSLQGLTDLIVVSGENFADALVASGLAGYLDICPRPEAGGCGRTAILLTRPTSLPAVTAEAITASTVPASRITVIGGAGAVSGAVHQQIARAAGWNGDGSNPSHRIAGRDRYETAAAVAARVRTLAGRSGAAPLPESYRTVMVVTGENFPDALSAGALAYRGGHLLLLARRGSVPAAIRDEIRALRARCALVIGGTNVLNSTAMSGVWSALGTSVGTCGVRRIAGTNRYDTARILADEYLHRLAQPGEQVEVLLASGENFADALTAAPLTGTRIILLTQARQLPAPTRTWALTRPDRIDALTVIGGTRAVSADVAIEANNPRPRLMGRPVGTRPASAPLPAQADHDVCRIPQVAFDPNSYLARHSVGFPVDYENLPPRGDISLVTIPIDWSDYPAEPSDLARKHEQVQIFIDYYEQASGGQLSFTTNFASKWYRMPEPITAYPQGKASDFNNKLAQHAVDAVDPDLDFAQIDIVIFVFPDFPPIPVTDSPFPFASTQHFNRGGAPGDDPRNIFSEEGFVRNYAGGGNHFDHWIRPVWSYYIHEVAHMFNIPDWYMREANTTNSEFLPDLDYAIGPMSNWAVMSTQDGPSRTFVAWTRWLMGWLTPSQVACFELADIRGHGSFTAELVALDVNEPGLKAVMIRTGPHSGLVIESRRPVFPDHDLVYLEPFGRRPAGLVVYRVDTTKGNSDGTLILVPPQGQTTIPVQLSDRFDARMIDALYNVGAVGLAEGLRIELVYSGDRDIVQISPQ